MRSHTMRSQANGAVAPHSARASDMTRRATYGVMGLATVGLVVAILVGAPLVSVLLAGLLLVCPLLLWKPFRSERRGLDTVSPTPRDKGSPMTGVVVLTSPACHFCADAIEALRELSHEFPLEVVELDIRSPEGRVVLDRFRPSMSPAVLVNGDLFSSGRLPRKKLRRLLESAESVA